MVVHVLLTWLTWLLGAVIWVLKILWRIVVRRMQKRMLEAIIPSDFVVSVVTGQDPLRLSLKFILHNGSGFVIRLNKVTVHLFCGGSHVGSVVGPVLDNPFVDVSPRSSTIGRGVDVNLSIDITPDIYLWFWLLPSGGYDLYSSSIEILTNWGAIDIPLVGNIVSEVCQHKDPIHEFLKRVKDFFGWGSLPAVP